MKTMIDFKKALVKLKQSLCSPHGVHVDDLKRNADGLTEVQCSKCGKTLIGNGGLQLPNTQIDYAPKQNPRQQS